MSTRNGRYTNIEKVFTAQINTTKKYFITIEEVYMCVLKMWICCLRATARDTYRLHCTCRTVGINGSVCHILKIVYTRIYELFCRRTTKVSSTPSRPSPCTNISDWQLRLTRWSTSVIRSSSSSSSSSRGCSASLLTDAIWRVISRD